MTALPETLSKNIRLTFFMNRKVVGCVVVLVEYRNVAEPILIFPFTFKLLSERQHSSLPQEVRKAAVCCLNDIGPQNSSFASAKN